MMAEGAVAFSALSAIQESGALLLLSAVEDMLARL